MRTTILTATEGEDAVLAAGALEAEAYCVGGADDALVLEVRPGGEREIRSLSQTRLLLARVARPLELLVRPVRGGTFPTGLTVGLQLTSRTTGEQVVLNPVGVAGAAEVVLLRLTESQGELRVSAVATGLHLGAGGSPREVAAGPGPQAPEAVLLPEWERAVASVRRALGQPATEPGRQGKMAVIVDLSASMLAPAARGQTEALLDALLGFVALCGRDGKAPVWAASSAAVKLPQELSVKQGAALRENLRNRVPSCGSAVAPALEKARATRDHVLVLTDDVPADLADVGAVLAKHPDALVHLVVIGFSSYEQDLTPHAWQEELSALDPLVGQGLLFVTSVAPAARDRPVRLHDDDVLDALTRGLVEAWQTP